MTRRNRSKGCSILAAVLLLVAMIPPMQLQAAGRAQNAGDELVVVIDAGHGGDNLGAKDFGTPEKDRTLITALAMYDELNKYEGVKVYMTRTADTNMELDQRAQFAKDVGADFLFSIHYNASESHRLYGSEVFVSAQAPYNGYGYQFGAICLTNLSSMGLYNRGVKCKESNSEDYYGLIRESTKRGIPSALIEHCFLDHESDKSYADSTDKLKKLGQMDAKSVAQYFGLRSSILGVDYSGTDYVTVDANKLVPQTASNGKGPDECQVSLWNNNPSTGDITIAVHGFDTNAAILYYDYSLDGGMTYTPLYKWPNANPLFNTNDNDFTLSFHLPASAGATFVLRNFNMFDYATSSNVLDLNSQVLSTEFAQGKPITPVPDFSTETTSTMDALVPDYVPPEDVTVSEDTQVAGDNTTVEPPTEDHTTRSTTRDPVVAVLLLAGMSLIIVLLLVLVVRLVLLEHRKS